MDITSMIEGRLSLATFGLQMQVQALQADDDADIEDGIQTVSESPKPPVDVDKLPTRISTAMDVETDCSICLKAFKQGETMRVLPCQHEFHQECIDRWLLDSNRTCPCCRLEVCAE